LQLFGKRSSKETKLFFKILVEKSENRRVEKVLPGLVMENSGHKKKIK
jgi:hypothetical protein